MATSQSFTVDSALRMTSDRTVQAAGAFPFSIAYTSATQTYAVSDESRTRLFGPSTKSKDTSVPELYPAVQYTVTSGGEADYLTIFKDPNATPPVVTTYSDIGNWQYNTSLPSGFRARLDYFALGEQTVAANMPRSGRVVYRLIGQGNSLEPDRLYFTTMDIRLVVDFAAGTVTANVAPAGTDFFVGSFGGTTGFSIDGRISDNGSSGANSYTVATWSGRYRIAFYGPNAEEAGLVFSGAGINGSHAGSAVGVRFNS